MSNLVGEFHHKLDAKGRVSLPASFRKALPDNLKVMLSLEGECLYIFTPDGFDQWVDALFAKMGGYDPTDRKLRDYRRVINSRARDIEVDGAGRINISADLRSDTGLEKEVVINGDTDHLEVWDAKRWDDFKGAVDLSALMKG